jgi:hypothetical protein
MPSDSTSKKRKSVLRTIRITEDQDEVLRKDSKSSGLYVNALLSTIITKYVEWDRFSDRFGSVSFSKEVFKSLIESTDEKKLRDTAKDLGSRIPKETLLFWRKKLSIDSFLSFLFLVAKYQKTAEYEVETREGETIITARHEFGERWSMWLKTFLDETLRNSFGIQAQFDVSKSFVVATFKS